MATVGPITFPSNGFDAVIFDCDGTLVDSMPAHFEAWCHALAMHGAAGIFCEDVFFAMGGRPSTDIVEELNCEYDLKLDPDSVAAAKREAFLKRLGSVTLIDEVADFARSLRQRRVPMAIATGSNRMTVEKTLQAVGVSDWFDEVVSSEEVAEGKPAPDVFLRAAELLGVPWATSGIGPFSPVYLNDGLTLDFIETDEPFPIEHYCFRVSEDDFDAILGRIKAADIPYRRAVRGPVDRKINSEFGGRIIYWNEPDGHQWEILTVSYARQAP